MTCTYSQYTVSILILCSDTWHFHFHFYSSSLRCFYTVISELGLVNLNQGHDWSLIGHVLKSTRLSIYSLSSQLTMHIRANEKLWGQKNCLQKSETGLCQGTDLSKAKKISAAGPAKPSNWQRSALIQEMTRNLMVTELLCGDEKKIQSDNSLTAILLTTWALWHSGQTEVSPQWKMQQSLLGVCKKAPNRLLYWEKQYSLIWLNQYCLASNLNIMSGGNLASLITGPLTSQQHGGGKIALSRSFSVAGPGGLVRVEGTLNKTEYRDIFNESLVQSIEDLSLGSVARSTQPR